jgi:beta-glucosidase
MRPRKELQGFERIHLTPGETRRVTFTLPAAELVFWDVTRGRWAVESGTYDLMVGRSSADLPLSASIAVDGETIPARDLLQATRAENYDEYKNVRLTDEGKLCGGCRPDPWRAA